MPFDKLPKSSLKRRQPKTDLIKSKSRSDNDIMMSQYHCRQPNDTSNYDSLYRISRKRIIDSAIESERRQRRQRNSVKILMDNHDSPSDEGIYVHSESSSTEHSFRKGHHFR